MNNEEITQNAKQAECGSQSQKQKILATLNWPQLLSDFVKFSTLSYELVPFALCSKLYQNIAAKSASDAAIEKG